MLVPLGFVNANNNCPSSLERRLPEEICCEHNVIVHLNDASPCCWSDVMCPIVFFLTDPAGNYRQKSVVSDICYQTEISSLMDFGTPDSSLDKGRVLPWKYRVLPW